MTNTQDFTTFFKAVPTAVDSAAMTDAWKTWTIFGERFGAIAIDAASKSNDVTTHTVKEMLALMRSLTDVQDDPADYAKVVSDFGTAQVEVVKTHVEALGDVAKVAQSDVTDLLSKTGQHVTAQSTKAANDAGTKTKASATKPSKAA